MKKHNIFILILLFILYPLQARIVIYCEQDPPANYVDPNGELTGSSVEIVREIQRRIGDSTPIVVKPWARAYYELETFDNVLLFSTTRTEAREDLFQWVGPILRVKWIMYKKKGSPIIINDLDDARKLKQIGCYRSDARTEFLQNLGFTNLYIASSNTHLCQMVKLGRLDVFLSSNLGYPTIVGDVGLSPDDFEPAYKFHQYDLYIAFSRKIDPVIVEKWQKTLDEMKADGSFEKIYKKYFPKEEIPY